jgi:hypothetical protein
MTDSDVSEDTIGFVELVAEDIAENTKISEKQAKALVLKEILNANNEQIADALDVASPASASSYVTRCRTKFKEVNNGIEKLETDIKRWNNTKKVHQELESKDYEPEEIGAFRKNLLSSFDTTTKYLVRYLDDDDNERVQISHTVDPDDITRPVIDYRRIRSVDDLF